MLGDICSRSVIAAAMEEYAQRTCIRWVPRSTEDYDYIYIVPDRGCYSMVGKTGKCLLLLLHLSFNRHS